MFKGWKLDKHIPVALLVTLLLHLCSTIWAVAKFTSHVENIDSELARSQILNDKRDEKLDVLQGISYRVDTRLALMENSMGEIKTAIKEGNKHR